ncbi:MAG: hypothetical protein HC875_37990 [Anaerolineales bacterium]|nr:hypothetical protein [Anaerolineales bacterium]
MEWETLYCPNKRCRYYGLPFRQGKMVKNGSSYGQPQALCKGCGSSVALSYATAYCDLESDWTIFETAVRAGLRVHHLIKKVGQRYKYYLTDFGRQIVTMALKLREMVVIPGLTSEAQVQA